MQLVQSRRVAGGMAAAIAIFRNFLNKSRWLFHIYWLPYQNFSAGNPTGAKLFLSKVPLEVPQNGLLIQLIDTPHIVENLQGLMKELFQSIEPCLVIGTRG